MVAQLEIQRRQEIIKNDLLSSVTMLQQREPQESAEEQPENNNNFEEESKEHELNVSQYDLESEDIIEWAPHEDNKIQIKYYDAAQNLENNPINFYQNIARNYSEISE